MFSVLSRPSLLLLRPSIRGLSALQRPTIQYRPATASDEALQPLDAKNPLNAARPLSPHLTIYEPQLTWLMSIGHRVTGAGLSAGIYAFGIYYALMAPETVTSDLASFIARDCPTAMVVLGKYVLGAPFIYHTLNGIRHLVPNDFLFISNLAYY